DDLQARANKQIGRKDQVVGSFGGQRIRTDNTNLFGFLDTGRILGLNATVNWRHNFNPRFFINTGYQYSRFTVRTNPFFADRQNVPGAAGTPDNNQDPAIGGPPSLPSASGISPLSDQQSSLTRNQTSGVSFDSFMTPSRHNLTFGADFKRQ